MITVSILYPQSEDTTFDMAYYTTKHMPMFVEHLGEVCKGWGVADVKGNDYHALAWALVSSADAFKATMKEHGDEIIGDVTNYTNSTAIMIMGEIVANS
jgi:uncharacterized protein (TIGR02118 family)